jgi:cytochrome c oxidase assembly protein subunit 15
LTRSPGAPSDRAAAHDAGGPRASSAFASWRHRFSLLLVAATLVLIFVGGLVTSTGSGLSVPDWPLSYGMVMPPMVGGVFYEHGHRMVASTVGFLTLVLAVWTARAERRTGVRRLAWAALAAVVAQGVLGGLTVIFLLPTPISVTHACLAQAFFCMTIALAYATSREWAEPAAAEDLHGLRAAAAAATAVVFMQLVLGAIMRHIGAGLAIPDFPRMYGRWVPPVEVLERAPIAVHLAHRAGALVVFALVLRLVWRAWRARERRLAGPANLALALVLVQFALGAATVLTGKAVLPTTGHVATGAAILGLCWLTTLRARRRLRASVASAAVTVPLGDPALL